ncbi:MAG: SpoIID/LytB domain-containing protein [Candidatus Coatesbacteria bacterium]|nr:SpoIID/LytB domain-containing protein [Candidatus Coatesbacteria bacterium]
MRHLTRRLNGRFATRLGRGAGFMLLLVCASLAIMLQQAAPAGNDALDDVSVSVQLTVGRSPVNVALPSGASLLSTVKCGPGEPADTSDAATSFSVEARGSSLILNGKNARTSRIAVESNDGVVIVNDNRYRGRIEVEAASGRVLVANVLPLSSYLASVLGAEMPDDAPLEALKAQSVISRSYIIHRMIAENASYPPVCDSIFSQVYKGVSSERPSSVEAVQATAGLVLTWNGAPIDACFSASSGGYTASAKDVWDTSVPYLIGKSDPFSEGGEYAQWKLELTADECERLLRKAGRDVGELHEIVVSKADKSRRASRVALKGGKARITMRGTDLRLCFGTRRLRSTMFEVERTPLGFVFRGKGYGHGVGLSQEGACRMAQAGYSFERILHFYYTGVRLEQYSARPEQQGR